MDAPPSGTVRRLRSAYRRWIALLIVAASAACGDSAPTSSAAIDVTDRCLVRLHGKGGTGAEPFTDGGVAVLAPTGNADGWGARQWSYFPDEAYDAARARVADAVEPCARVIINGFSNGAAFAAKLYCRGETFGGRVVGMVVDDPVTDSAVVGCRPNASVALTLYWTGALEKTAPPGWDCAKADWTCEGGSTIGIAAYATALGTDARPSPFDEHKWYLDAPELAAW